MSSPPTPRPRRRAFRAPWNRRPPPVERAAWVDAVGVFIAAVAICVVAAACGAVLIGGMLVRSVSNNYNPEKRARAAPVDYYAAVVRQDYKAAGTLFRPERSEAELVSLWARREAGGPRVVDFTATSVALFTGQGGVTEGTVTDTLRYADGTTVPLTVRV